MQHLLQRAKEGTKVRYITGNHDEFLRNYGALKFDNIEIVDEYRLRNKDGRDFLVIHGDQYDVVTQHAPWIATLGTLATTCCCALTSCSTRPSQFDTITGRCPWAKNTIKQAVSYMGDFIYRWQKKERAEILFSRPHMHVNREVAGVHYLNCGDWVILHGYCSPHDGEFERNTSKRKSQRVQGNQQPGAQHGV